MSTRRWPWLTSLRTPPHRPRQRTEGRPYRARLSVLSALACALTPAMIGAAAVPAGAQQPLRLEYRTSAAAANGVVFDDFSYTGSNDPAITAHNWTIRSYAGGPGVPGASWPKGNVTFPTIGGANKAMQLRAVTNGTGGGTQQAEMFHRRKFFEGTYAARVKFSDAPASGPDGDNVVQAFFTITPLAYDLDPDYGELDFEYLPNGGWGARGPIMFMTSWETYRNEPWRAVNTQNASTRSHDGWRTLVMQVSGGTIRYYIDGSLVAQHGGTYYPETPMSVNFNLWFIADGLIGGSAQRAYVQQVDWFYHAKNEVVSPAQVDSRVNGYRSSSTTWVDTVAG